MILFFSEGGFSSQIIGTGRENNPRVPPWILGPELQYLIFFRSHKSKASILISSEIICHRAKLTGKLGKGRERALGSENLVLSGAAASRAQFRRKKISGVGKSHERKNLFTGAGNSSSSTSPILSIFHVFEPLSCPCLDHSCSTVPAMQILKFPKAAASNSEK